MKTTAFRGCMVTLMAVTVLWLGGYSALARDGKTTCDGHDHHQHFAQFAKVPEQARERRDPLEGDADAIAAGRKLFTQRCSECHGDDAEGSRKAPNLHADEIQSATPGALFWILSNGVIRKGMPDWSKLPEPQRWQIVTYLKTLKESGEKAANEAKLRSAIGLSKP